MIHTRAILVIEERIKQHPEKWEPTCLDSREKKYVNSWIKSMRKRQPRATFQITKYVPVKE